MNRDLDRDHNDPGPDSFIATAGSEVMSKQQHHMNEYMGKFLVAITRIFHGKFHCINKRVFFVHLEGSLSY